MTQTQERRRHPRLPMHLSIAKLVDFRCEGVEGTAPAILVDLSAGGLAMICFAMPQSAKNINFRLNLPGLVNAQVNGKIIRMTRKGDTFQVAVEFLEFQEQWSNLVSKLTKAYNVCEERLAQGDRRFCFRECAFFSLCEKDEKARVFPKAVA